MWSITTTFECEPGKHQITVTDDCELSDFSVCPDHSAADGGPSLRLVGRVTLFSEEIPFSGTARAHPPIPVAE